MVCDSVQSVSPSSHTSLQKNVNGGVEPWSLMTKWNDLGYQRDLGEKNDLDDQRKDLNESKAARPKKVFRFHFSRVKQSG